MPISRRRFVAELSSAAAIAGNLPGFARTAAGCSVRPPTTRSGSEPGSSNWRPVGSSRRRHITDSSRDRFCASPRGARWLLISQMRLMCRSSCTGTGRPCRSTSMAQRKRARHSSRHMESGGLHSRQDRRGSASINARPGRRGLGRGTVQRPGRTGVHRTAFRPWAI